MVLETLSNAAGNIADESEKYCPWFLKTLPIKMENIAHDFFQALPIILENHGQRFLALSPSLIEGLRTSTRIVLLNALSGRIA